MSPPIFNHLHTRMSTCPPVQESAVGARATSVGPYAGTPPRSGAAPTCARRSSPPAGTDRSPREGVPCHRPHPHRRISAATATPIGVSTNSRFAARAPATRRIGPDTADLPRRGRVRARVTDEVEPPGRMRYTDIATSQEPVCRATCRIQQPSNRLGVAPRARRIGRTSSRTPCGVARPDAPFSASGCVRRPKGDAREMPRHQPAVGLGAARSD